MENSSRPSGSHIEPLIFKADIASAGKRLDIFLASKLPQLSRNQIKRLIDEGLVRSAAGRSLKVGMKLKGGETLGVTLPEPEPIDALPEALPLNILYEDSSIIVIDKPAGMVVHPAAGHHTGTLVNALLFHCKDLSGIGGRLRPGIVHRLDKDTSGVMIATKNDTAHRNMAKQFKAHTVTRRYRALVYGRMDDKGTVDLPLGRSQRDRKKISIVEGGRRAVTHWKVLERYQGVTFVELTLETGRTHQIRVHLSQKGHPIVGDQCYGSAKRAREIASAAARSKVQGLKRQALHACMLGFSHPENGEYMQFSSPLPEDMADVIQAMEAAV